MIMYGTVFVVVLFLSPLLYAMVQTRLSLPRRRHQQCLANIDRLERELFPEYFKDDPLSLSIRPGQRWLVDDANSIQVYANPYDKSVKANAAILYKQEITRV